MSCCPVKIKKGEYFELLGRIVGWEGTPILQSDVSTITYSAFILEQATGDEDEVDSFQDLPLVVADVLSDSLIINPDKWKEDSEGYNFHFVAPGDIFTQRGELYGIRITFELTDPDLDPLIAVYLFEVV